MTTIKVTPEQLIAVSKKFELALQTVMQMNSKLSQHISFMERFWEGITKEQFYYRFQTSQKNMNEFVTLTDSIAKELRHHADKFRLTDLLETGNIDASCLPPPPNSCSVPAPDTRNAFQKSADSLAELGQDFVVANSERYEKKFDSFWSFMDYMTYGIPKGMYQGYMERAAKQNDSWNDMLNFGTFGVTGMIQGAFNPTNAWSKEHWANMIGTAGLMIGSTSTKALIKPKNLLEGSVKYEGAKSTSNILKDSEQRSSIIKSNDFNYAETGARNISPDQFFREEAIAEELYEKFRNLGNQDVEAISKNTGFSQNRIQRIKDHVFNDIHIKDHGIGRFDPDFELSQAWERLIDGKYVDSDVQLLHHELFESRFEGIFHTNYRTAHDKTVESGRPWNWEKIYEE
ncbi:WXG100 family type VII secretion target [Paenibacillus polymyxa]|uniref:WXG100 family type VII secretion target n=1 Tax=Paenibacillus TaxID=44249 RepID=UPI000F4F53F0|nr:MULTISPECIES: WXG100 family type VII secretion target [Paenibacillus]KAF6653029.1 WXG100 family type VII secretion target [Paenibacillus sp. EKM301P]RPE04849.1 WXG100 family type VII secretion target [Paenibacillus polymyxa]UBS89398.1 WXG100 family type VII secretion target [Paenibacillus polymyxa]WHX38089.1 WXG100 family type VII secretion target [Paenibacillus polymyxa]